MSRLSLTIVVLLLAPAIGSYACETRPAPGAQPPSSASAPAPDRVPIFDSLSLVSVLVSETRRINVHVPEGYTTSTARFPVLYMPDGGIDEDFPHVVNTLDSLVQLGQARPFIVVGIPNTERRRDMTGPTTVHSDSAIAPRVGGSAAFRGFIRDELMPEIRKRYRTTGETAIVGESLAGLFVMETFLTEPAMFDRYIAISPSLWWNQEELLRTAPERLGRLASLQRTLFLTAAGDDVIPQADTLAGILRGADMSGLSLHFEPMPGEKHATIFRAVAPRAFRAVLGVK